MEPIRQRSGSPVATQRHGNNDRVIDVLHELICGTERGVRGLAERLGESRSTVNRVLKQLTEEGLAQHNVGGTYAVGPRLRVLVRRQGECQLIAEAGALLDELAHSCNATAVLALHDPSRARCVVVAVTDAPGPVRYLVVPGTELPLHAGAAGRAVLSEVGVKALGDEPLERFTTETVIDRDQLRDLVDADRRAGYAISIGQRFDLAAGVAAHFRHGGLVGAVSVTRPREDVTDADLDTAVRHVRKVARQLSALPTGTHSEPTAEAQQNWVSDRTSTVGRFERLLADLAGNDSTPAGRRDVAELIGASPATAAKLVETLVETGVATGWGNRISAGPRLFQWAAVIGSGSGAADVVAHIVSNLARDTGETVGLAEYIPEQGCAQFVAIHLGTRQLHYQLTLGEQLPLHAGAAGKAILAFLPPEMLVGRELERYSEQTLSSVADLEPALSEVRARGWATGTGERVTDAFGLAAPYFVDGRVGGSITVTVPRHRSADIDAAALGAQVAAAAAQVTRLFTVRAGGGTPQAVSELG